MKNIIFYFITGYGNTIAKKITYKNESTTNTPIKNKTININDPKNSTTP